MNRKHAALSAALAGAAVVLLSLASTLVGSASPKATPKAKPKSNLATAEELLKPAPRPKKPALPPSQLPLELTRGERLALVGNSTAERMNLFGHFETLLHVRFPEHGLVVRNFARPADEVALRQRPSDYTKLDDPLTAFNADTFVCFFGFNESFAGPAGVAKFQADYERYLDEMARSYPRDDVGSPPRFVLVSPMGFEAGVGRNLPDAGAIGANLKLYADAVKAVAAKRQLAFVDVLGPTQTQMAAEPGWQLTINGCHTNAAGDRVLAETLDQALFGGTNPGLKQFSPAELERIRAAVNDKSWVHLQDYRMLNGWYVYGGRRTWDTETFPREYAKIRSMAAVRDQYVWSLAQRKPVAEKPDDAETGELITPRTRFGEPRQKYSEDQEAGPRILSPEDFLKTCTVPEGFEIKLFADEKRFPELAKPVQMSFDNRGRLWVSTMPSYPQWKPGDPRPSDKLVILEDTDGDGSADKSTVFYDKLHCPTGFEFYNGGVLVVSQPRMLWLRDANGDDKADEVVEVLDGWATEDTHHTVGAFESSPAGRLHMLEGVAMSTAVETPWGPHRNFGSSGAYVLDPRTWKVSHYVTPGYGNPWCYVFNEWGQGIVGDGTGANQHWDTPLSGAQYPGRKGLNAVFNTESMRPVVGSEFLVSRHFPDDVQGQFIYACVINMNGIPRWTIADDGAGYRGTRVRHDPKDPKSAFDLIKSTDKHFRPVDPQIGPDGALWFGDWANPLIGHMQYSQRDPNRDHVHGRVYRLVYKNNPLLRPVTQLGKTNRELLEQLREYEWRTRCRARRELQARPEAEVLAEAKAWVAALPESDPAGDRLRCEALWLQASFHAVDEGLLKSLLTAKTPEARAAAVRVAADEREYLPAALELLIAASADSHPRVRTEALRGLSFFPTLPAATAVLAAMQASPDYYVQYTGEAALAANLGTWRGSFLKGEFAKGDVAAKRVLDGIIATDKKGAQLVPYLQVLLGRDPTTEEQRNKAMQAIADIKGGNRDNGRAVFKRNCIACHQVGGEGANFGPQMDGNPDGKGPVGKRLSRLKIVQSVIDPNAEVDAKYLSTLIATADGEVITGLLVSETKEEVVLFDGKTKRTIKVADIDQRKLTKQSSMPEGLAATMSPVEFLDVIEFLSSLK